MSNDNNKEIFARVYIDDKAADEKLKRFMDAYEEFQNAALALHQQGGNCVSVVLTSKGPE